MKKIHLLFLFQLLVSNIILAQDTIRHKNGENFVGKVKSFANKKFTILLSDKTEITFAKDSVVEIVFDIDGIYENVGIVKQEEEMDRDCATKNIGNIKIINLSGKKLNISFENKDSYSFTTYQITDSKDSINFNGLKAGNYVWTASDNGGFNASGGFYVPPCKTAKTIIIK